MPNMMDYLDWRGDLSFSSAPFSEVDNMILSELAFVDYRAVLPDGFQESVPLSVLAERMRRYRSEDSCETGVILPKTILPLFYKAASSVRFGSVRFCGFVSRIDTACEAQFSAVTALLGDGTVFVAYRGTDDTLVGWKEDFNMSFLPFVPSQSYAVRYLEEMAEVYPERIRLGGHSKGGNLAVYAAANASISTQRRIIEVYNNDGPGFSRELLRSDGYGRIRGRVRTIVPQSSVVGMLLEHEGDYTIVKSTESGILQHDGFSWEVIGASFVRIRALTEESVLLDRTLKAWIAGLDGASREAFVDALYRILSSTSAETITELREDKDALLKMLRSITKEERTLLQKTLRELIDTRQRVLREARDGKRLERTVEREAVKEARRARAEEERAERTVEREAVKEAKRARAEEERAERLRRQRRRAALMVAVRPIRFRIVKAKMPIASPPAASDPEPRGQKP